jgi:phosphate-selective porin OprO/OprP
MAPPTATGTTGVEDAGQLYEGWAQYSGFKPFHIRAGAWPQPIGLEDQMSTNNQMFLERPGISDVARNLAAGDTRIGAGVFGYQNNWFAALNVTGRTIGVVNTGTVITAGSTPFTTNVGAAQTFGDQIGVVGRAVVSPFHGDDWRVTVGAHGSFVDRPGDTAGPDVNGVFPVNAFGVRLRDTSELRVDGTQLIDTGSIPAHNASSFGGELAGVKGPFFAEGEVESIHVDRADGIRSPSFSGFYVEGSWFLTGESRQYNPSTASFDGPALQHNFSWREGHPGAVELAVRYSDTNLNFDAGPLGSAPSPDTVRGGDLSIWSFGVNWYPNNVFHFMLDVDRVKVDRLSPNATVYNTPVGAQIGQSYTVVAVRTQAAF